MFSFLLGLESWRRLFAWRLALAQRPFSSGHCAALASIETGLSVLGAQRPNEPSFLGSPLPWALELGFGILMFTWSLWALCLGIEHICKLSQSSARKLNPGNFAAGPLSHMAGSRLRAGWMMFSETCTPQSCSALCRPWRATTNGCRAGGTSAISGSSSRGPFCQTYLLAHSGSHCRWGRKQKRACLLLSLARQLIFSQMSVVSAAVNSRSDKALPLPGSSESPLVPSQIFQTS